jgi:hypothetical protein
VFKVQSYRLVGQPFCERASSSRLDGQGKREKEEEEEEIID